MSRGTNFRDEILAGFDLTAPDRLLLDEVAAVIEEIDGLPVKAIVERRQQRVLLNRLLGALNVPEPASGEVKAFPADGKSIRGQRAANIRWAREARK